MKWRAARTPLALLLAWALALGSLSLGAPSAYADVRDSDQVGGITLAERPVADAPSVVAPCALVAAEDGTVLWERGSNLRMPMASTTKIMTCILAIENADLDMECFVTKGADMTGGTSAWILEGDVTTLYNLLIGLMLPSGNDAAVAIAENIAGTQFDFVNMMNEKAVELGMLNTHYVDAHGLNEDGLYSTVSDYLILARYAMRNETFRNLAQMREATIYINGRQIDYITTNKLFWRMDGVLGIKTGTNYEADACLVACVMNRGTTYYSVVFGSPTDETRYQDTQNMLEWAFKHYRPVELISPQTHVADLGLTSWLDKTVAVRAPYPVSLAVFDLGGPIAQEVELYDWEGAVTRGQKVGRVIFSQGGEVLATSDLVADATVEAPGPWESVSIRWQRFTNGLSGSEAHAPTRVYLSDSFEIPPPPSPE